MAIRFFIRSLAYALTLVSPVWAQPTLAITSVGANADGNLEWRVDVQPDRSLFSGGNGSLAAEIGFELTGSVFLDATVNDSVWSFETSGFNPFTDTITKGLMQSDRETYVALGSDPISGAVELLTLTTQGSSTTTLRWGGQDIRPDHPAGFEGARLAQAGLKFDRISGFLMAGSGGAVGDCNGDGLVNAGDLVCACGVGVIDDVLGATGLIAGDLDGSGEIAFADFLTLSGNFGKSDVGYAGGDINCDGLVAFADFLVLSGNFGKSTANLSAAPEPSLHGALPCLACLALAYRKRSK